MECDFCGAVLVRWSYPAKDFIAFELENSNGGAISVGGWAACDECHELIENGDDVSLAFHSLNNLLEKHPDWKPEEPGLFEQLLKVHGQFFSSRLGPAEPVEI